MDDVVPLFTIFQELVLNVNNNGGMKVEKSFILQYSTNSLFEDIFIILILFKLVKLYPIIVPYKTDSFHQIHLMIRKAACEYLIVV